jgi:hypothetical protein
VEPSAPSANQGLVALSDNGDFSFGLASDGTNVGLLPRTVTDGHPTTVLEDPTFRQYKTPVYLRLTRSGVAVIASHSLDGMHWAQATNFTYTGYITLIGPL